MNNYRRVSRGILLAALASGSWGISGTVLQLISQNLAIPAPWMLSMRTFSAGVLLLAISLVLYDELSNQAQLCPEENFKWTLPA